jgi:hypothetical protein
VGLVSIFTYGENIVQGIILYDNSKCSYSVTAAPRCSSGLTGRPRYVEQQV